MNRTNASFRPILDDLVPRGQASVATIDTSLFTSFPPTNLFYRFGILSVLLTGLALGKSGHLGNSCMAQQTEAPSAAGGSSQSTPPSAIAIPDWKRFPLADFRPQSRLRLFHSQPQQASFPVVDIHTHFAIRLRHDPEALEQFVQMMDRNNIALCCSLDATLNDSFDAHCDYLWSKHADRFLLFANIDFIGRGPSLVERANAARDPQAKKGDPDTDYASWSCNQSDFVHRTVIQLEEAKRRGISGVKFFKQFGLEYRNADGSFLEIDDPRLAPIFDTCGRLGLPVILHTADPSAFFEPIDQTNERLEELSRHPDWAFPSPPFPSRESLYAARSRLFARHPQTRFIAAHMANDAEDLAEVEAWLKQHPNLFIEIASRISELGRQPYTAKRFFERYADRILFGTDGPWPEERLKIYWRFLQSRDENFAYSEKPFPPQGFWNIHAIQLSHGTLKKIYYENAMTLIPGVKERLNAWMSKQPFAKMEALESIGQLHNVFRLGELLCGSQPESGDDLDALQQLGVRTIISVDGLPPDFEAARIRGLEYVHIPFGYDTIPSLQQQHLISTYLRRDGLIYLHCHHGKHRGPAAAALTAIACQGMSQEAALEFMGRAGTSRTYDGLWESVKTFTPFPSSEWSSLPSLQATPSETLALKMARLDRAWGELKKQSGAANLGVGATSKTMLQLSALVREELRESHRLLESQKGPEALLAAMEASWQSAKEIENVIEGEEWPKLQPSILRLQEHCDTCHQTHRN